MKKIGDKGTLASDVLREYCRRCGGYTKYKAIGTSSIKPTVGRWEDERLENGVVLYVRRPKHCEKCGDKTVADMYTVELKETDFDKILSLISQLPAD